MNKYNTKMSKEYLDNCYLINNNRFIFVQKNTLYVRVRIGLQKNINKFKFY